MPIFHVFILILFIPTSEPHFCGNELVEMLELVCNGQYFGIYRTKRSQQNSSTYNKLESRERDLKDLKSILVRKRGGVADECCVRSCSFETLQNYCLHDSKNNLMNALMAADQPAPEVEERPAPAPTTPSSVNPEPTTHPIRTGGVRSRGRNMWFFFKNIGANPTRQPNYS